jgi:hypothetical protein
MKKLIIPAIICIIIAACTQPAPPPPASLVDTVGENNKAVVQQYTDAVTKGDTVGMGSFLSDNYKGYGPGLNDSTDRAKTIANWSNNWKNEFASMAFDRATTTAFTIPADGKFPGDWVADWAYITVNYKNGNKPISFWFNGVYRLTNGKIDRSRAFYNVNDFFQQQGYVVTPPKAPAKK